MIVVLFNSDNTLRSTSVKGSGAADCLISWSPGGGAAALYRHPPIRNVSASAVHRGLRASPYFGFPLLSLVEVSSYDHHPSMIVDFCLGFQFVERRLYGDLDLSRICQRLSWRDIIVKQCLSASSYLLFFLPCLADLLWYSECVLNLMLSKQRCAEYGAQVR